MSNGELGTASASKMKQQSDDPCLDSLWPDYADLREFLQAWKAGQSQHFSMSAVETMLLNTYRANASVREYF